MEEYPFEKITVEMIIKKSELSKATFYRYYIDKFDVMNFSYVNFVEKIFKFHLCKNFKDIFVRLLVNADENATRIKNAYAYNGTNSFTKFLHDYSYKKFMEFIKENRHDKSNDEEKLRISLFCYGFIWIINDYIDKKIDLTKEEIADIMLNSLPDSIQNVWNA